MSLQFPKFLSIQTTSLCNGACIFCPYSDIKDLFPKAIMNEQLYRKIIDECSRHREIERIILYLNNEPLTDPYLIRRINYAKEAVPWASIHILTNGALLTEEMSSRLLDSKLDWLGFSLHGIKEETFQKAMGLNYDLTFSQVLNFIEKAKEKKDIKNFIMVTFLRHKYLTIEEEKEAIKFWHNKGIERISYFDAPISRAGNVKDLPAVRHAAISGCASIWANEMIHIVENGDVVLCCMDWRREAILGNVNTQSIYDIWNSSVYNRIRDKRDGREDSEDDFICKRCESAISEKTKEGPETPLNINNKKSADILLVTCPPWGVDSPPLSIASLSSYLRKKGVTSAVFDFNLFVYNRAPAEMKHLWSMNYSHLWRDKNEFSRIHGKLKDIITEGLNEIAAFKAGAIGISLPTNCSDLLFRSIIGRIKKGTPGAKVIVGGVSISIDEQRKAVLHGISPLIDYCVIGEGEAPLYKILEDRIDPDAELNIEGVIRGADFQKAAMPFSEPSFNAVAFPTFEEFNLSQYAQPESLLIEFSRGCIGNCIFCDFRKISPKFKIKEPPFVLRQIDFYKKKYNINHLCVVDSAVNGNMKFLEGLSDLLIREKSTINISALAIPRKEMTGQLLKKMRKAGFYRLEYGIESGSNKILRLMKKIFTVEDAEKVIRDSYGAGIKVYAYFMAGFPGESEEDFEETKQFLIRNRYHITAIRSINPLYIMAGSEIHRRYKEYKISLPDKEQDINWHIGKENTPVIRKKRVLGLKELARKLEIVLEEDAERSDFVMSPPKHAQLLGDEKTKSNGSGVLLVTLPPWGVENPPIGLGYLDAYLRRRGVEPGVFDFNIYFYNTADEHYKRLWHVENKNYWSNEGTYPLLLEIFKRQIDYAVERILSAEADLIGFSVVDPKERITIEVIKRIKSKAPEKKIILGGPACSTEEQRDFFTENIPGYIDYFVVGEGEETLCEVIAKERKVLKADRLSGLAVKENGNWHYTARMPVSPLDKIPFPTYEGFDLKQYGESKSLLLEWSRGCIGRCSFCKNYRLTEGYRSRSADAIFKELEFLVNHYGVKEFTVCDNLMNGDIRQLREVCDRLIQAPFKVIWSGQITPRKEMDQDLFRKMRLAGCSRIQIGVESGSDKVLRHMKKIYARRVAEDNLRMAKKSGMETEIFIMVGFPGEREGDFRKTCNFIKRNSKYIDTIKSINTLHLIAGTDIYENYARFNLKPLPKTDWYYLWETYDGNTYKVRKERARRLLGLAYDLGIKVMETNIMEGKESIFKEIQDGKKPEIKVDLLKTSINELQELPQRRVFKRKKRSLFKWIILTVISLCTFFYITYFWLYMIFRNRILLGGKKK